MKIRSITLTNVRRFAGQTAVISGIGDGISVVAQPNEFGKSTFFDALQAVFFTAFGSKSREIMSLQSQPAKGAVEVSVEIDMPAGRFRIDKRFVSKAMARVTDLTRSKVVAQDDEAENWIRTVTDQGLAGPAGLLWVRQGVTRLESDDKGENARALTERRNLLSAVAGEIDLMTGGRRMDRVRDRVTDELGRLALASGKPKAGGPWKEARDEVDRLTAQVASLSVTCRELSDALARRRVVEVRLAVLEDPEAQARRIAALSAAREAVALAEAHAASCAEARRTVEIAALRHKDHDGRLTALQQAITQTDKARLASEAARMAEAAIAARLEEAMQVESAAAAQARASGDILRQLRERLDHLRRQAQARAARDRLAQITARLTEAETQRGRIEASEGRIAANRVTGDLVRSIDRAAMALAEARAVANARAVSITLHYDGATRALRDGAPLAVGTTPLHGRTELTLPGIGRMVIDPGASGTGTETADLKRAERALEQALAEAGVTSPEAAHLALRTRQEDEQDLRLAEALMKSAAPDGIAALRTLWARTKAEAGDEPETSSADQPEDAAVIEADLTRTEAAEAEARVKLDTARATVAALSAERAGVRISLSAALTAMDEAEAAAGEAATRRDRLALAASEAARAGEDLAKAEHALATLVASAPDLATGRAEFNRASGVVTETAREIEGLRMDRARLEGEIGKQADLGVEERLSEAEGALIAARERDARYGAEVVALTHLLSVLDETRTAAREAYFGPVQRELQPLLAILAENAALTFDDDRLLPGLLDRQGHAEPVDTLSGGTQEQIAILTRLAFAQLFAKAGRPVPVILDDALVHTDDDRIRRMFTALHRVAVDQQVIVFTCRQLAFQDLGGARPMVTVTAQT